MALHRAKLKAHWMMLKSARFVNHSGQTLTVGWQQQRHCLQKV